MLLEQQVRRNDAEMEEEEFWQNELQIEQESEQQLRQKLAELQGAVRDCEAKLAEYLALIQVSSASLGSFLIPLDAFFLGEVKNIMKSYIFHVKSHCSFSPTNAIKQKHAVAIGALHCETEN